MLRPLLLLLSLVAVVRPHKWALGSCPRVDAQPKVDLDKFLGTWHVISQTDTGSECYTLKYTRVSPTVLRVTKARQHPGLRNVGLQHNTYAGTIDIPDEDNQGRLRVKWPLNMAGKGDYVIFETDYTGYAAIFDCQELPIGHRRNAAILSRQPTLSPLIEAELRTKLSKMGVDDDLDGITHGPQCQRVNGTELTVHLDPNTVPDFFSSVADGITETGTAVIDGIRGFSDSIFGPDVPTKQEAFEIGVPLTNEGEVEAEKKIPEFTDDAFTVDLPVEEIVILNFPEGNLPEGNLPEGKEVFEVIPESPNREVFKEKTTSTKKPTTTTTYEITPKLPKNLPENVDDTINEIEPVDNGGFIRTVVDIGI